MFTIITIDLWVPDVFNRLNGWSLTVLRISPSQRLISDRLTYFTVSTVHIWPPHVFYRLNGSYLTASRISPTQRLISDRLTYFTDSMVWYLTASRISPTQRFISDRLTYFTDSTVHIWPPHVFHRLNGSYLTASRISPTQRFISDRLTYFTVSTVHIWVSPSEATRATTIEVAVEELCTNTVAMTPIISPAMGLESNSLFLKVSPAVRPDD